METNFSTNAFELVKSLTFQNVPGSPIDAVNIDTRTYKYITYKDAVANLSKSSEHHLNEKKFLDLCDRESLMFLFEVQDKLDPHIPRTSVSYMKLRGRKDKSFTAWVLLQENAVPIRVDASFLEAVATGDFKVTAVTLLTSTEEVRGLRISLKESKTRLYEIVNGIYEIVFHWKVGNKDCRVVVCVNSNGTVAFGNLSKDFNSDDLEKNKAVSIRIGDVSNREMTLAELISRGYPM